MSKSLEALVIEKTSRIPAPVGPTGDGDVAARQFDVVLMSAGFKLSTEVLTHLSGLSTGAVIDVALRVLPVARQLVGDHVKHNAYFIDFPRNVPNTLDFWAGCLREALLDPIAAGPVELQASAGILNLLSLPSYGRYQHTYEELLAAHAELIPSARDRVTVLHLGGALDDEVQALYVSMAGSRVPLGEDDLSVLGVLAEHCVSGPQSEAIPVRENRAVINEIRLAHRVPLLVDTVTDVLRLACALSGGDVTLREPTRFRPFRRAERRAFLIALDGVVEASPVKLGDVGVYREQWKRLGERLHPHEYPRWSHAQDVFAVARGDKAAPSFNSRVEAALDAGDVAGAMSVLAGAPGLLFRSLDRLLRAATGRDRDVLVDAVEAMAGRVSGRVILSVREHVQNRTARRGGSRVFVNRAGRAWVAADDRPPLDAAVAGRLFAVLDAEVQRRLPDVDHLVIDPAVLGVALPLSAKTTPRGFGVMPRGSVSRIDGDLLRFFTYWQQTEQRTDYDLSAVMLDANYQNPSHLSWTNLTHVAGEHSGDIVEAPDGATEFINLDLRRVDRRFIIPLVLVYSGEGFEETKESFFGYMLRDHDQQGRPFEAATVRMKSDLRGAGRVALPMVFMRGEDGRWYAKWLHFYLKGHPAFNQVEGARVTTALLMRAVVEREYLKMNYLIDLLAAKAKTVSAGGELGELDSPVTFIGIDRPEGLPDGSDVYVLNSLRDLIPT